MDLRDLYKTIDKYKDKEVTLQGWIKNHRKQKEFGFIDFYDGTDFLSMQIIYDQDLSNFDDIQKLRIGSSITVEGILVSSVGNGQDYEIKATSIKLEGDSLEDYPIQPKRHTREFLREVAYLRPRTNLFQALFRVRSVVSYAIHTYFMEHGFVYLHSPIITASDSEGAGEMFQVTTLDLNKLKGNIDYKQDFFGKKTGLSVSGQLQAETFALSFKKTYTFGPTFRAENSHTKTHASEFWMIEPEVAFADLSDIMSLEEDVLKFIIDYILKNCPKEMELFDKYVEVGLIDRLKKVLNSKFAKVTHEEAINILLKADKKFDYTPKHGEDIQTEHEKYLTEEHFKSPVFITNWPKDIKAFYMRLNDDSKTVAAVDLIVPGSGELMGGSQREERLEILESRMDELGISKEELYWYLNLRKYGGCIHSGFGIGFERLLMYLTGIENIRDVIPFPRTPKSCDF